MSDLAAHLKPPIAVPVYGVWLSRRYTSGGGLDKLFESNDDAYAYANRQNNGPRRTGDNWSVHEHVLHLDSGRD